MIKKIKHIQGIFDANLPVDEYVVINSVWLTLMGLRVNGDLDLLISSKLWNDNFSDKPKNLSFGIPGSYEGRLRVHSIDSGPYGKLSSVKNNDDVVYNHRILIDNIPLVEPSLYFQYKAERFLKMDQEISKIPKWKRNTLLAGENKHLIRKWTKDFNDFKMLKSYFGKGKHLNPYFSEVTKQQWGLDDDFIMSIILKS